MRRLAWPGRVTLGAAVVMAFACSSLQTPTEPAPEHSSTATGQPGVTIGAPAPAPTPSASPSPDGQPSPSPNPSSGNEGGAACGEPLPPAVSKIDAKVHLHGANAWILDATPLVGPDADYCRKIGFTDGRSFCAVRPEGNPQRSACELFAIGRAKDTGRPGPTWYLDGQLCRGGGSCDNHPDNQYLLMAYRAGTYQACAVNGVCGEVVVDR